MKNKNTQSSPFVRGGLYNFKIYNTIVAVPSDIWSSITHDAMFMRIAYFKALENSKISGLQMRYVVVEKGSEPIAALQIQILNVADKDLNGVINLKEKGWLLNNLHNPLNQLMFKCGGERPNYLICCGSLLVSGEYGICVSGKETLFETGELLPEIVKSVKHSFPDASYCGCMVKDFFDNAPVDLVLNHQNYFELPMDPEMIFYVRDEWKSFQDYLASLSAKYRLKANNSLSRTAHLEKRFLSLREIKEYGTQIMQLYDNVQKRAAIQLIKVSDSYFINLKKEMPEQFYLKAFFDEDKPVAFTSGFHVSGGHHEAHFIGIDYSLNTSLQLYQNILYSYIDDAIQMKSKHLYFGRTAMEIKTTVGAKAFPLHSYFRLENKVMNKMAKTILKHIPEQSWIPRNPFKE